jgi:hypothetical protein
VGKLTVATELSKLTGIKLFHNHLTQDLVREIYPEFDEKRFKLVQKIRIDVIEYAAENNTDLLFTFVHSGDESDNAYIAKIVDTVRSVDGQVMFVQLIAKTEDILNRVDNDSRKKFHKLTDADILKTKLTNGEWRSAVAYDDIYEVDTSLLDAKQAARRIVDHFNLSSLAPQP